VKHCEEFWGKCAFSNPDFIVTKNSPLRNIQDERNKMMKHLNQKYSFWENILFITQKYQLL